MLCTDGRSRVAAQEEAFQQHDVLELFTVLLDALSSSVSDGHAGSEGGACTPASLFEFEMADVLSYVLPSGERIRRGRRVPEKNLSLYLDETTTSLEAAVQRYVSAETIEGFQADEASGTRVTATKALRFASLPACLLFHLQRFNYDWERQRRVKVDQLCAFPLTIDMENFMDEECSTMCGPTAYELSAVLIHSGTAYSGHYFAYVRDPGQGTWFEFNDEKVTLLAQDDGPEMDPSFFERVFGGSASAAGGGASSMSAYGLIYRRADAAKTVPTSTMSGAGEHDASLPESVPPPADLAAVVAAENLRWESSRAEYIRKRDAVTFEVHSSDIRPTIGEEMVESAPTMTVTLDKTCTLTAAIEACMAAIEMPLQTGVEQCRLRAFDTDSVSAKGRALGSTRSCTNISASTLEQLGLWRRTPQHVVLELADGDGQFPAIEPDTVAVQLVMYSGSVSAPPADAFSAPIEITVSIPAEGDLDIAMVARSISAQLSEPEQSHHTEFRLAVVDASTSRPRLVGNDAVAAALIAKSEQVSSDVSEPLAVYATLVEDESKVEDKAASVGRMSMEEAFELRASMCVLRVQVMGFDTEAGDETGSEYELEISRYDTIDQLRSAIASVASLSPQDFIITSRSSGQELKDGTWHLDDATLDLTDGVVASAGIPLQANQSRVKVLRREGTQTAIGVVPIGEFIAQPDTTVSELLQSFAQSMGGSGTVVPTDASSSSSDSCIRVRHQRNDGRLGRICSHALSLGESLGVDILMSGTAIVLEKLATPEDVRPGAVVVLLRRWDSSNSSLGEPVEIIVEESWEMSDLLKSILSMHLGEEDLLLVASEPEPEPEPELEPEPEPESEVEPVNATEAQVQVIRPWAYQMKDPSSLHLANWSQPGFAKRAAGLKISAGTSTNNDLRLAGTQANKTDRIAPPQVEDKVKEKKKEWNLKDGDELVWRPRPAGVSLAQVDGAGHAAAVHEKGITIQVHSVSETRPRAS